MKRLWIVLLFLIALLFMASCSGNPKKDDSGLKVDIYYLNTNTSGLVGVSYDLISKDINEQIKELVYMIRRNPDNLVYKSVLPNNIKMDYKLGDDKGLTINFDSSYGDLSAVDELLCRAALVKTICQLKEIEYVQINVNGSPLIDSNKDVVGPLTAEDFVDDTQSGMNYKVKLYFANKKGDALVEYNKDLEYTGSDTIEELVINQLISGPTKEGTYATIPKGTELLDVNKNDGTCYVDFNEKFLNKLSSVSKDVAIYSVVNSLVELPDINKVEFRINGKKVKTYMESKDFNVPFERNLDLLEKTE